MLKIKKKKYHSGVNGNVVIGNYRMFSVSLVNKLTFKNKIALDCFLNLIFCASELVSNCYLYLQMYHDK